LYATRSTLLAAAFRVVCKRPGRRQAATHTKSARVWTSPQLLSRSVASSHITRHREEHVTNNVLAILFVFLIGTGLSEAQTIGAVAAPSGAAASVRPDSARGSQISESARREALAFVQRNNLARDVTMSGLAQGGPSRKRHSIYFPIKVGAGVGCGSGATLAYFISPHMGDPAPNPGARRATAMAESCVVGSLMGAGLGYLIAAH
jgi:hypothetical protein